MGGNLLSTGNRRGNGQPSRPPFPQESGLEITHWGTHVRVLQSDTEENGLLERKVFSQETVPASSSENTTKKVSFQKLGLS